MVAGRSTGVQQLTLELGSSAPAREPGGVCVRPVPEPFVRLSRELEGSEGLRREARTLALGLQRLVGERVVLFVHENRSTMLSFRRRELRLELRLHQVFLEAPPPVLEALADFTMTSSESAGRTLDAFVSERARLLSPPLIEALSPRGKVHDLAELFEALNATYFAGGIEARIGWGRGSRKAGRRSIRLGAYYPESRSILIHPALDSREVPEWFLGLIVFHEMLHQAVPGGRDSAGRRCVHTPEFRRRERLYAHYARARDWERVHLPMLLGEKG